MCTCIFKFAYTSSLLRRFPDLNQSQQRSNESCKYTSMYKTYHKTQQDPWSSQIGLN